MKKRLLSAAVFFTIFANVNAADRYKYLEFVTTDNSSIVLDAEGLVISASDGTLSAVNSAGQSLNINAASLISMQFTDSSTSIAEISCEHNSAAVRIYKLDGTVIGTFSTVEIAMLHLVPGVVYVVKSDDGTTAKIIVGK